jgi:signal recognition particle subunit SRP14
VQDDPLWDLNPPNPLPIIIRATDGRSQSKDGKRKKDKIKLSTVVQPDDIESFYAKYAEVCKAGMQSLKKRDRSKRKKDKSKKKKAAGDEKKS